MGTAHPESNGAKTHACEFVTTHWSVVRRAGKGDSPEATQALEHLCRSYWYPLYAFIRRKGHSPADAQDLTQDFFARFLEKHYLALADQNRGKFRTFLLRSLEHFLINEWNKASAAKRGGTKPPISWDQQDAESRYLLEPMDGASPDKLFEKRWALGLLDLALERLRQDYVDSHKEGLFDALKPCIWEQDSSGSYERIGLKLGMSEGAVKVAAYRMRLRYRELLCEEVANTVDTQADVDEELRYLAAVLRS